VKVNSTITSVTRPKESDFIKLPSIVTGYNSHNLLPFVYTCGSVIVAFPQVVENMKFMDLDVTEIELFSQVEYNLYYDGIANPTGPAPSNGSYNFVTWNQKNPFLQATYPAVIEVYRDLPYGPTAIYASSPNPLTSKQIEAVVKKNLANLPTSLITEANFDYLNEHIYLPHPTTFSLQQAPNFYTRLNDLQGKRKTYYTGALVTYAGSYLCWEQAYRLVNKFFPLMKDNKTTV